VTVLDQRTFISAIAPFNRLSPQELDFVISAMDVAYYRKDDRLIHHNSTPDSFFIIIKGIVQESDEEGMIALHSRQDTFDAMSLLEGSSKHEFTAQEELLCYLLPKKVFLKLIEENSSFQTFFYQNLSEKLHHLIEQRNTKEMTSFLVAKIREAYVRSPVTIEGDVTIYTAVETMKKHKSTYILVRRDGKCGIVTDADIREHVVLQRRSLDSAVGDIATYNLITVQREDFLLNALLLMTKHSIKRVVVYDETEIAGVLEQMDLISFFSNHSHLIMVQIDRANSKIELKQASRNLLNMIQILHARGIKIRYITQLVNELNKKIFEKLYSFIVPSELLENSCLLVMGSEGRGEQILKTDQDNAIILRDDFAMSGLGKITEEFTEALIEFGYPPCAGNVMVKNPYWCKPLQDFKEEIYQWIQQPKEESMMNLAIFYDATAVAGDNILLKEAKDYLFQLLQDNRSFYAHFARPTLAFETPLGFFVDFIVEYSSHKNQLDIKKGGIFPIVQGIRSLALEYRLTSTNTVDRIDDLRQRGIFDAAFAEELTESFSFMLALRLQFELERIKFNQEYDNYIDPTQLNKLERDLLKDSLKIVNEFKKIVTYHFKLNMVS
jgi:CBS domain-containing protein